MYNRVTGTPLPAALRVETAIHSGSTNQLKFFTDSAVVYAKVAGTSDVRAIARMRQQVELSTLTVSS